MENVFKWSRDEERILEVLSQKAFDMSEHHKKNFRSLQQQLKYYKIPIIVISGINSVVAVGMDTYLSQETISATTCLLSLMCGIIGSIELYLKISENMNQEFISGRDFFLLHIDIKKTLALESKNRNVDGDVYLSGIYNKYVKNVGAADIMLGPKLFHSFEERDVRRLKMEIERDLKQQEEQTAKKRTKKVTTKEEKHGDERDEEMGPLIHVE